LKPAVHQLATIPVYIGATRKDKAGRVLAKSVCKTNLLCCSLRDKLLHRVENRVVGLAKVSCL